MTNKVTQALQIFKSIIFRDPQELLDEERHLTNKPFFFRGTNGKGVLLVHGWTATPYELRRLGKYLNENGYTASGILLKGHGTVPKNLEKVKWQDWLEDVDRGYKELRQECGKVFVCGTSIGGSLALLYAQQNPEVAGIVPMATPYKLKYETFVMFFSRIISKIKNYHRKIYPPTFGGRNIITRTVSYQTYPMSNVEEVVSLVRKSRNNLSKIFQPCFVLQSTTDHMVSKNSMEEIYAGVRSEKKNKKWIKHHYHTFISDIRNERVFEDILKFLNEL